MSFKILAILYTEFNLEKGPELVYQEPDNYVKIKEFNKISEFVVPSTHFCNKEVNLHLGNAYLLGYPIFLNNSNYDRNRFEFNFCIIIDEAEYEYNNYLYDCLIKKINTTFENIEIDYSFNFMKNNMNMIRKFIIHLFNDFKNNKSVINIHINEDDIENENNINKEITETEEEEDIDINNNINLIPLEKIRSDDYTSSKSKRDIPRVFQKSPLDLTYHSSTKEIFKSDFLNHINNPKKSNIKKQINFSFRYIDFTHIKINIQNYYVPVWIKEIDKEEINKLDAINSRIISNINGINSVYKIAQMVSKKLDLVKYALSSLYIIRGITFIDILHDSNIYKPTNELKNLKIEGLYEKFNKFCIMNKDDNLNEINYNDEEDKEYMNDKKLFSYYVLLANSKDIKSFREKLKSIEFNLNLFVGFGVYLGIIRRIHLYFYYVGKGPIIDEIYSLMDGKHCEDEISIEKGISVEMLCEKYKDSEDKTYYLYK
jgi:hypothetical protein